MDEFRRQIETVQWPVVMRVDGKEVAVNSRENLMVPTAGNLVCAYSDGAFQVIDCKHVSIIHRETTNRS